MIFLSLLINIYFPTMNVVFEPYDTTHIPHLMELFFETIKTSNPEDYNLEEIAAWTPDTSDLERWTERISNNYCILAKIDQSVAGFAEISPVGNIDMIFIHKDFQGKQIGKQLVNQLETYATEQQMTKITVETDKKTLPFFSGQGYSIKDENTIVIQNVELKNILLEKQL